MSQNQYQCPNCQRGLRYIPEYNTWFCDSCKLYPYLQPQQQQIGYASTQQQPNIQQYPQQPIYHSSSTNSNLKIIAIAVIIMIFIGILFFIILYESGPTWQQYDKYDSGNNTVWKNEDLDTQITKVYDTDFWGTGYYYFEAESWGLNVCRGSTPNSLLDEILKQSNSLSSTQLKWYEYMCKNVIG